MSERLSSAPRGNERFVARRRSRRRRALIALCLVIVLLGAGIVYELAQSGVRINHVDISGADQSLAAIAFRQMQGNYFGIIPRDSIFFFPAGHIRAALLASDPNIAAVSMFRSGFTGLSIKVSDRVPVARWCGLTPSSGEDEYCYFFDASGFIYAASATSTQTVNNFSVYAPLVGGTLEPLRATIVNAEKLPAAFDFARQLNTFGSPVSSIVFRSDEVDDYVASGTRITYVLGNEQNAFTALTSARDTINLADGSLDYVDLRFDGKVYVKKKQ
jgi:hypothetical protein